MSREARVGLVTLLGFVVVLVTVVFLRGEGVPRRGGYELTVLFDNVGGLEVGTPVRMAGVAVGRVRTVALGPDLRGHVTITLNSGIAIPQGSRFAVATMGLIGDRYLGITPGPATAPPLAPQARVEGEEPTSLEQLGERFEQVAARVETLLENVNTLVADPEVRRNLQAAVRNAREVTALAREAAANVERTTDRVLALVESDVAATGRNLREMSRILVDTARRVDQFISSASGDGALARDMRATAAGLREASQRIAAMAADLQQLINQDNVRQAQEMVNQARETVRDAQALVRRANSVVERVGGALGGGPSGRLLRLDYEVWVAGGRTGHGLDLLVLPDAAQFYRLGLQDIGASNGIVLQYGQRLAPNFKGRVGVYASQFGLGVDYQLLHPFWLSLDLYNPNRITLDVMGRYRLSSQWHVSLGGRDILRQPLFLFGIGYGF